MGCFFTLRANQHYTDSKEMLQLSLKASPVLPPVLLSWAHFNNHTAGHRSGVLLPARRNFHFCCRKLWTYWRHRINLAHVSPPRQALRSLFAPEVHPKEARVWEQLKQAGELGKQLEGPGSLRDGSGTPMWLCWRDVNKHCDTEQLVGVQDGSWRSARVLGLKEQCSK